MSVVLRAADVDVEFPLTSGAGIWRIALGLSSDVPTHQALTSVDVEVPHGQIVGIIGRNGAGKSTLLRVLGGVLHPTRGRVDAFGAIAGIFELGGLGNPQLTGREYAVRYLRLVDTGRNNLSETLDDIQAFSELDDAFDRPIRTYSSGMAGRLYFATATASDRDIYLIDEVLAVGDEHFQSKCRERMRQLLTGGASGVLVTHDWSSILRLCNEALVLERGAIAFEGPSDEAVVHYLGIKPPPATSARIVEANGIFHGEAGADAELAFGIEIVDGGNVELSVSIEELRIGSGWEIILLSEWVTVGDEPGTYDARVRIPALPLAPGSYSLNVFLRRRFAAGLTVLDLRSWTAGNGLKLVVNGTPSDTPLLPFTVGHDAER